MLSTKHLISIADLKKTDIQLILERADHFKRKGPSAFLKNKIVASCFFEPSTRTRLSFEVAVQRLGGQVIGFSSGETTSAQKGESLSDTIRVISSYADAIVIRHPMEGAARLASTVSEKPVLNAGDGANQHPSQTLVDLFTIQECQGKLDGLNIVLAGDLKYARTIHSLAQAYAHFDVRFYFVSPATLQMPDSITNSLRDKGIRFSMHTDLMEVIKKADILYMTRLQKERFDPAEFQTIQRQFQLTHHELEGVKPNLRILHPLPRQEELSVDLDATPHAYYFEQAENGVYVRQALLSLMLGGEA